MQGHVREDEASRRDSVRRVEEAIMMRYDIIAEECEVK